MRIISETIAIWVPIFSLAITKMTYIWKQHKHQHTKL